MDASKPVNTRLMARKESSAKARERESTRFTVHPRSIFGRNVPLNWCGVKGQYWDGIGQNLNQLALPSNWPFELRRGLDQEIIWREQPSGLICRKRQSRKRCRARQAEVHSRST